MAVILEGLPYFFAKGISDIVIADKLPSRTRDPYLLQRAGSLSPLGHVDPISKPSGVICTLFRISNCKVGVEQHD